MGNDRLSIPRLMDGSLSSRHPRIRTVDYAGRKMRLLIDSALWALIAGGAAMACWGVARMIGSFSYDKPKPKIAHTDTLFRGAKQCHNCRHHSISTEHPLLACGQRSVKVDPHHFCDEWA